MDSDDEFFYHTFIDTLDESSDDDSDIMVAVAALIHNFNENAVPQHVGSVVGQAPALDRERENGHLRLWKDYFNPVKTTYLASVFRRYFRMSRPLFMRLLEGVRAYDDPELRNLFPLSFGFLKPRILNTKFTLIVCWQSHLSLRWSEIIVLKWSIVFGSSNSLGLGSGSG